MMTKLEPPQIRATTGLELATGIFAKCSDGLAKQLNISLTAGKRESGTNEFRIGINGDIYGGLLAPVEVGTRAPGLDERSRGAAGLRVADQVQPGSGGQQRACLPQTR